MIVFKVRWIFFGWCLSNWRVDKFFFYDNDIFFVVFVLWNLLVCFFYESYIIMYLIFDLVFLIVFFNEKVLFFG